MLQCGGVGEHGEHGHVVGGLDSVGADGGQVGEQAGEAVYRGVIGGGFAGGFGRRGIGALSGGNGIGAFGGGCRFVVVTKQQGGQTALYAGVY